MGWSSNRWPAFLKGLFRNKNHTEDDQTVRTECPNLPLSPRELLRGRNIYEIPLMKRRADEKTDAPLAALYRIYEHIMLDQHIEMRNEFESFWFRHEWKICNIPDPQDPDPERYAVLACIPSLLCLAFNKRIQLGLPRDAPPIFTHDQLDEWRTQERELEAEPAWTNAVRKLDEPLSIPHWDNEKRAFVTLDGFENEKASDEFKRKNIWVWQPHIHFI